MAATVVEPGSELNRWLYLVLALCPAVVLIIFYRYVYKPQQYFKSIGVPGPEPSLLTGNLSLFSSFKGGRFGFFKHLQRTYGDVCGYYMCQRPFLVLHDPDFVKQITIKDFDKFTDHFENGGLVPYWADNGKQYSGLLITQGHKWRSARNIVTPTFSTHKMKLMESLIHSSTSRLAEKFDSVAGTGKSIDVLQYYSKMTMEVILATAFGRSLDVQSGKGGKLYASAITSFTYFQSNTGPLIKLILMIENAWPSTKSIFRRLLRYTAAGEAMQYLGESVKLMIEQRRKGGPEAERKDLLQLMMDANAASEEKLEDGQMISTAIGFLLGGYETTSSALSFASYLLALNPAIQDKLANDIHDYQEAHPDASLYDTAQEIEYLNMVFDETLRLYPPGIAILRLCGEDCTVEGIPIKKGVSVMFPLYSYHRQPDIWPDPEKFDPDRFSAEEKAKRHPYAYLPFGVGPRSCVGMRLALLEAKMTLIEVLTKYRLVCSTETEVPLQLKYGITMAAKNGVLLKIEKRNWD